MNITLLGPDMDLTPRTEAEKPFRWADLTPDQQWNQNGYYVDADFARTLERELNAAHAYQYCIG